MRLPSARRPYALLVALAALLGALVTLPGSTAAAAQQPRIVIDSVVAEAPPAGLPAGAAPSVLVEAGGSLTVTVHLESGPASNPKLASLGVDTAITVTTGTTGSSFTPTGSSTFAAGSTSRVAVAGTMGAVATGVTLTVSAAGASPATSVAFDVQIDLQKYTAPKDTASEKGIGGGDGACVAPTPDQPICGVVLLPHGAAGDAGNVALSIGACDDFSVGGGACAKNYTVQVLADLDDDSGALYTRTDPATLVVKCDKTQCGTKAIQKQTLKYSLLGDGGLVSTAAACPAKLTVGADGLPCVDYVQSKRDGSGDTYLFLLFLKDLRGAWN